MTAQQRLPQKLPASIASFWSPRSGHLLERGCGQGKVLFLDASTSGVAGDMLAAALLDLGVPFEAMKAAVRALPLSGAFMAVERCSRSGIVAPRFVVQQLSQQPFRDYAAIRAMLSDAPGLPGGARDIALRAFRVLAEAEAATHGMAVDEVHFHEVGAVDSIVDIVAAAAGLDYVGATHVVASPLPMGRGIIHGAAHGPLPNPPPATLGVIAAARAPTFYSGSSKELVTPTGACLVAAVAQAYCEWPDMVPTHSSYGAGSADFADRPNLFRVVLGEPSPSSGRGQPALSWAGRGSLQAAAQQPLDSPTLGGSGGAAHSQHKHSHDDHAAHSHSHEGHSHAHDSHHHHGEHSHDHSHDHHHH